MPFSALQITKLKARPAAYYVTETGVASDQRGLQLRVHPGGAKTFWFRYPWGKTTERVRLGAWPTMTLADAHAALQEQRAKLRDGIRPAKDAQVRKQHCQERAANTVEALADEFVNRELRNLRRDDAGAWVPHDPPRPVKREKWRECERMLEKDVLPVLGYRPLHTIEAREIANLLAAVADRGAPIGANRLHAVLCQMFEYATGQGWLPADRNPCRDLRRPTAKEPSRERYLTDDELRTFLEALESAAMLPYMKFIYRLILATGQRPGEVMGAQWDEINLVRGEWIIPAARTKTRDHDHTVPLSTFAHQQLRELRALHKKPWLFPCFRASRNAPIDDKAAARAIRNNRESWGIPDFTPHDLRRTVRSGLAALKVDTIVAKKLLNHKLDGMDAVYNQHPYAEEKSKAIEAWGRHLQQLMAPAPAITASNVIAFRGRR